MNFKRILRIAGKAALWLTGIWIGLLLLIQIVLSSPVLSKIVHSVADDYIDADVKFSKAYVSVFRHFPRITLNLEDLEITYPSDRYDSLEQKSVQGYLLYSGCSDQADTLASVKKLSASLSLSSLIFGNIKLPHIDIDSPRVFAHSYDDQHANWNIFKSEGGEEPAAETEPADTTRKETSGESSGEGMDIILGRISITGKPRIVYTDSQDTLFASISLRSMSIDGKFNTGAIHKTRINAHMDSLFIAGRYGLDTLAMGIDVLDIKDNSGEMTVKAEAKTFVATETFGRMKVPISIAGKVSLPEDPGIAVSVRELDADIASIPISGQADVKLRSEETVVDGQIRITDCQVQHIIDNYLTTYIPELKSVRTDSRISADASISGSFDDLTGNMPAITVNLTVPESEIDYSSFPDKITVGIDAGMTMDTLGRMDADLSKVCLRTYGLHLHGSGGAKELTSDDPVLRIDADLKASFDSLRAFLPDTLNIHARGNLAAELKGTARMSNLSMYDFSSADLEGRIISDGIEVQMPEDSIDIRLKALDIKLEPEEIKSRRDPSKSFRMMTLSASLENADFQYSDVMHFTGKDLVFNARNSSDRLPGDTAHINFLSGSLNAGLLEMEDSEKTTIKLEKTENRFRMHPKKGQPDVPVLALNNKNLRISYISPDQRLILTDSHIEAEAAMTTIERARRRKAYLDSLALIYPDIPRDSLFRHNRRMRTQEPAQAWMQEDDFKSEDISIDFGESFKKYFREWEINGGIGVRTGILMTPYFPLRNILRGAECNFTNNAITIDSIKFISGESTIAARGSLSGLRRALLRNGTIDLDMEFTSDCVNADELMMAYNLGSQYQPAESGTSQTEVSNAEFFKQVTVDTIKTVEHSSSLFVVPGNINAHIGIDASGIKYKDLDINSFTADMRMKERCIQLTNTQMKSNMGGILFEAFYATRSKEDIRTGFCLDLTDITAERVIALVPEVGEIMPMIGSISGLLNCEIAATAEMDTTMSIKMNTVNGIARLGGRKLTIEDDEVYTSVAKKLMFRNKNKGVIDNLMVEGVIKDNSLEIFPFIIKLDRYTLGLSGIQNLDMSYKHHVSVLRSPLLIRLGLNLSGPDYDHMKFRLGRAQYRTKKIPSFTAVIDQTKNDLRYSIYNIFNNGVDKTIQNSDISSGIKVHQHEIGYINPAEVEIEELSEQEIEQYGENMASDALYEETMAAAMQAMRKIIEENTSHE